MNALACDVGGTNTRMGLVRDGLLLADSVVIYRNDDFSDFYAVATAYLARTGLAAVDTVCIALASVATAEGATLTNRDWTISRSQVLATCGAARVGFINDFEALGFSLGQAARLETTCLTGGLTGGLTKGAGANEGAPRLVMGAGTGFNAAAWCPSRFGGAPHVVAAECGHMTLALAGEDEFSLQQALSRINGRASVERALSGNGLVAIYNWVCARHGVEARFSHGAEISSRAVERSDALCGEAAQMFMHLLGRVAGDLALAYLPYDGIYLSGGVTRALGPLLESEPAFLRAFTAKGRMAELMEQFSIHLLSDDASALHGCAEWVRLSSAA